MFQIFGQIFFFAYPLATKVSNESSRHVRDRKGNFFKKKTPSPSPCLIQTNERWPHGNRTGVPPTRQASGRRPTVKGTALELRAPDPCRKWKATARITVTNVLRRSPDVLMGPRVEWSSPAGSYQLPVCCLCAGMRERGH